MILARTNWDVPKHRGLTMFILKIHQPGVTVERIQQVFPNLRKTLSTAYGLAEAVGAAAAAR